MTNIAILSKFFDDRIKLSSDNKSLLRQLKSVSLARAKKSISEEQAVLKINKIMGYQKTPTPLFNPLAGVRTNHKKEKAVMEGFLDFNKKSKPQFPVFGLKPVKSNSKKKKFIVSPQSKSWFDVKDFKQPKQKFEKRMALNNVGNSKKAMNTMFSVAKAQQLKQPNLGLRPVLKVRKKKKVRSVFEMMGMKM